MHRTCSLGPAAGRHKNAVGPKTIEHGAIENRVWTYWQWRWVCILITSHLRLYISSKVKSSEDYSHEVSWCDRGKTGLLSCSTIMRTSTSHWYATLLLPITLSPGLGCLLGTCRIQIWSKLRNRLRTIATLVIVGQKWVIMCPHVVQARITITVCTSKYLNMNTQEQQYRMELHSW